MRLSVVSARWAPNSGRRRACQGAQAINLLHVVISLDCGGLERLVVDLANERERRQGGKTRIVCLDRAGELAADCAAPVLALDARRSRFPFDTGAVARLRRIILSEGINVVHSHNLAALQYSALALLGLRRGGNPVRHVHTEHGSNPHAAGLFARLRGRWLYDRADAVVAVSENTRLAVETAFRFKAAGARVIHNGVRVAAVAGAKAGRTALRQTLGIPTDACVVGSVGRLAQVKGYGRLIRAFAVMVQGGGVRVQGSGFRAASDQRPPTAGNRPPFLLLVGDGPERASLERLARELGVADRVVFAGFRADARELLGAMDLFVLSSLSEGLSMSLLEAMDAGVPVAVTDVGENKRVVDDGRCGTVLPGEEELWPGAIAGLLPVEGKKPESVEEKARLASERVAAHYSISSTLDEYERLYVGQFAVRQSSRNPERGTLSL